MTSNPTETFLLKRKLELEAELVQLYKALEAMKSSETSEIKQKNKNEVFTRTGQYWYKNRFCPAMGYATGNGYRVLYQLQDEGPNFVPDYSGHDHDLEFTTFKAAKDYINKYQDKGTIYTIISPEGEIVQ